jgi:hypothetical protein
MERGSYKHSSFRCRAVRRGRLDVYPNRSARAARMAIERQRELFGLPGKTCHFCVKLTQTRICIA